MGSGTIFNGKVDHSIVFRKVYIAEDAQVRNSILMEGCRIGRGCVVENAILDKDWAMQSVLISSSMPVGTAAFVFAR